jgi:hypothetical protein
VSWKDDASFTTFADSFEAVSFWGASDMTDMDSGHAMCQFVMSMTTTCDDKVQTMSVMDATLLKADVCKTDLMEVGVDHIADGGVSARLHIRAKAKPLAEPSSSSVPLSTVLHTYGAEIHRQHAYMCTLESNFSFRRIGIVVPYLATFFVNSAV